MLTQKYIKYSGFYLFIFICFFAVNSPAQDEDDPVQGVVEIDEINFVFTNTQNFQDSDLENIIKTGTTKYFKYEDFENDILRIEKFYFDNGYLDAVVDSATAFDNKNRINVTFKITENHPSKIIDIKYNGLDEVDNTLVQNLFSDGTPIIKTGDIYVKTKVSLEVNRILRSLQDNGYAFASCSSPEIEKFETLDENLKHTLKVVIDFQPGERYLFGNTSITIKDNKYNVSFDDVLKELEYVRGDIYSKEKLINSENRISRISIIENGRILIDNIDTVKRIINLKISAGIRNKYELQPELLFYEIQNQFFGGLGLSFSDKYFFGDARTFKAAVRGLVNSPQTYRTELVMEVFQPHIFGNNKITGSLNLTGLLYSIEEFWIEQIKNQTTLYYELPKFTYLNNLNLNWQLSNERIFFKTPVSVYDNDSLVILPEGAYINLFTSILGLTFIHNNTNNFSFPTSGFYQSYLVEESGLLSGLLQKLFKVSTVNYVKLTFLNKFYMPVTGNGEKSTLANKFLIGNIFEYGDNTLKVSGQIKDYATNIVPLEYRFIAGGSSSVRGWPARRLGTFPGSENGGNFIVEGSFEHRTRPFLDSKGIIKDVGFVTFFDYGNLWEFASKFKFSDVALAIGVGLRYYTIVGPFRLDFGFKLYDYAPSPGTSSWLFQNTISNIFKEKLTLQFGIGNTF
ncbi:MAG: BamA/TamA family outer membrane protein [Ignavibacteriae bacterium]|nr:BamA/TamA family outer membrane protein [Ignavibacteriota bacterium]